MALKPNTATGPVRFGDSAGYAASGASVWERQAARTGHADTDAIPMSKAEWSRLDNMIAHEFAQLARLRRRIAETTDPAKLTKLTDSKMKTQALLDRLRAEQRRLADRGGAGST
jgi:hypothetical protein